MKYFIIFTILFNVCLSQDLNKKKDVTTRNKKIGANIENAGNELVEFVNDYFRNLGFTVRLRCTVPPPPPLSLQRVKMMR